MTSIPPGTDQFKGYLTAPFAVFMVLVGLGSFAWGCGRVVREFSDLTSVLWIVAAICGGTALAFFEDRAERGLPGGSALRLSGVMALAGIILTLFALGPSGSWLTAFMLALGPMLVATVPLTYRRIRPDVGDFEEA